MKAPLTEIVYDKHALLSFEKFTCFGGNMKYIDWLIQWLENYIRPSVKVRTYERYRLIVEQHVSACPAIVYNRAFAKRQP